MLKKLLLTFGTRPEAVKMCPLVLELKAREARGECEVRVCVTAQHRGMLDQVLGAFGVTPDYDLNIMREGQTLDDIVCNVLRGFAPVLESYRPDILLVHGDTHTTLAASLAAFHRQITVGHVEAGLRTGDKLAPFPEEVARLIVDDIADLYFAPTELNRENLLREGKPSDHITVTGNTEIDALRYTVKTKNADAPESANLSLAGNAPLVLMTIHRRENLGEPMRSVFRAVRRFVEDYPEVQVVYPVHLNPQVQAPAHEILGGLERVSLIAPLEVTEMHNYMACAKFILTDSGGIQEDAAGLHKPLLVARDVTERPEGLVAGTLRLVGTDEDTVYANLVRLHTDAELYERMASAPNPFGDGFASARIADAILGVTHQ